MVCPVRIVIRGGILPPSSQSRDGQVLGDCERHLQGIWSTDASPRPPSPARPREAFRIKISKTPKHGQQYSRVRVNLFRTRFVHHLIKFVSCLPTFISFRVSDLCSAISIARRKAGLFVFSTASRAFEPGATALALKGSSWLGPR